MMTMLSKEEVEDKIELILDSDTGSDFTMLLDELLAHDQAQRVVIEELQKRNRTLEEYQTIVKGIEENLRKALDDNEQQAKEIIELKQQMVDCLKLNEADKAVVSRVVLKHSKTAAETIEQQAKEVSALKDAYSKEYQEHHQHCSEYSVKIAKLRETLQDKDDDVRHLTASVMQLVAIVRGSIYISDVTQSVLFKAEHLLKLIGEKQDQQALKEVSG